MVGEDGLQRSRRDGRGDLDLLAPKLRLGHEHLVVNLVALVLEQQSLLSHEQECASDNKAGDEGKKKSEHAGGRWGTRKHGDTGSRQLQLHAFADVVGTA